METMEKESPVTVELVEKDGEQQPPKIRNVAVEIAGRKVPLRLTTRAVIRIEEEMDMDVEELRQALNELKKKNTRAVVQSIRILGNEGLRLAGETADLTDDAVMDAVTPRERVLYRVAALAAITKGMYMETDTSYEEKQDVVLNEILKKNTGSPAGS